jgi:hypothetical protein
MKTGFTHNKRLIFSLFTLVLVVGLLFGIVGKIQAAPVPVTSIISVTPGVSVTVSGTNFMPPQTFTVKMGPYGSYGVGGTVVGSYNSISGSYFTASYAIPSALAGLDKIAIRFEGSGGSFSYNWFNNVTSSSTATAVPPAPGYLPGYVGYPTFDISTVSAGSSVTILTHNMPAGQAFTVRMGEYGTLGMGGTVVGTTADSGGSYSMTFAIPSWLAGHQRIAIRMDGPNGYYYAYNWFWNNTAPTVVNTPLPTAVPGSTPAAPPAPVPGYYGVPTISIASVLRDSKVTIYANNFPAGQTFTVRMGYYGSLGIGGTVITTIDSGSGGSFSATYDIPSSLYGSDRIAIRLETSNGYFNAYNWFYNNSTY